jgi:hypothetical protein
MTAEGQCRCGRGDKPARVPHPRQGDCLEAGMAKTLPMRYSRTLARLIKNAKELETYGVEMKFPPDFHVHPYRRRRAL